MFAGLVPRLLKDGELSGRIYFLYSGLQIGICGKFDPKMEIGSLS